jgi:uncharacterized membrane protein
MNAIAQFVRTTIVGGLLFLAPIVVLIVILAKAFDYAKKALNAFVVHIPAVSDLSAGVATALAVVLIALICFLAGLLARTLPAQHIVNALESSVLSKIPAYEYLKQESASALGAAQSTDLPVVFVPMEGDGGSAFKPNRWVTASSQSSSRARRTRIRVSLFLSRGHHSFCRRRAGGRAQLPEAMRRRRIRAQRQ